MSLKQAESIRKELELTYRTFNKLDEILDKTGPVSILSTSMPSQKFIETDTTYITINKYQLGGITIFKENHSETVKYRDIIPPVRSRSHYRRDNYKHNTKCDTPYQNRFVPRLVTKEYNLNIDSYFLIEDGKPVTDENRAKKIIKKITSEKVLSLWYNSPSRDYPSRNEKEIITDFPLYSEPHDELVDIGLWHFLHPTERNSPFQLTNSEIKNQLENIIEEIDHSPKRSFVEPTDSERLMMDTARETIIKID